MDSQQNPRHDEPFRPLVAADADIDPHRLVKLCCEHAAGGPLSVSLLVPVDDESEPWSESVAAAERFLHNADVLLNAAGVELETVVIADGAGGEVGRLVGLGEFDTLLVCAGDKATSCGVLALAARLAREQGLPVVEGGGRPDHAGWWRRLVGPHR